MTHESRPAFDPADLRGVNRRQFLRVSGTLSAAAAITAALNACGGPASTASTSAAANTATSAAGSGAAPSGGAAGGAPSGTISATLAFTLSGDFDPMNASSAVATAANEHIFEGLVNLDPITREPYPALAKAAPTASADGLTWTATLRDGAVFSDGTPVTADDVAWSFTRALDPANKALMAGFISFIDSVKAKGTDTVEFTLKSKFSLFPQRVAVIKIVPKALTKDADASKAFGAKPIGTGPYTLTSADATAGLAMAANPKYNGQKPPTVASMTWNTTLEDSTRVADLESHRVQAIENVPYINVTQVKAENFQVDEVQAFNQVFLMFNNSAAPFDDKRVRQALHYALDKDKIIKTALQGYGTAAKSYLDPGKKGYQEASTVYGYDPDKAKSLLADAGVTGLSFELVTTDNAIVKAAAPLIIDGWKQVGVNATLNTAPSSSVYGVAPEGLVANDKFRVLAASGDPSVFGPDVDLLLRWFYYGTTWPTDRARMDPALIKKLAGYIDDGAKAADAAQAADWKDALDLIAEEVPLYPIFHTKIVTGSDPAQLEGFKGAPTTGLYFLGVKRKA
ncbi:ABC transporter substrate-binding protein [Nakamurella lactea]|uniref:ABC transporter substrate-binding protein n=1 Tax=Nakamurella lactea TaxID=459515 RepID=UPI00040DFFE4|nr:ABC transporter substrate-binding protein [Nakamurella lactea]